MQTSQKSIFDLIEETSISSAEGFLVSPTQAQGNDLEKRMTATSGQKCLDAFGRFPRVGSWARMFSALLIGMEGWSSTKCRLTWKLKGTRFSRMYFQLQASTLPTEEIGSGLLLTEMLPTPTSMEVHAAERVAKVKGKQATLKSRKNGDNIQNGLLNHMDFYGMLPTPVKSDFQNRWPTENWQGNSDLPSVVNGQLGTRSQLNPQFVEEMMGFPTDWTILPFQSGETKA